VLKDYRCNAIQIRMLRSNKGWKVITRPEGSRMEATWSYSWVIQAKELNTDR